MGKHKKFPSAVCTFGPPIDVSAIFEICKDPRISLYESQKLIGDIIRSISKGHTRIFKIDSETGERIEVDLENRGPSKYQQKQLRKQQEEEDEES